MPPTLLQQDTPVAAGLAGPGADGFPALSYDELVARVCELTATNFRLRAKADQDGLILDSATDFAIITLNFGGQVTGWNRGAERLLGYSGTEALGRSGAIVFTPEDRANGVFVEELWRAFERGSANNERWHLRRDGTRFWASGTMMPLLDTDGMICGFLNIMRDGSAAVEAARQHEFLLEEARHKAKNTFATVFAVAARHAGAALPGSGTTLVAKLGALERSHDLMETGEAMLDDVVARALTPYDRAPGNARVSGPAVPLSGPVAAGLNSVLHELATNAAKYGAFSVPTGQVSVSWEMEAEAAPRVAVTWHEAGGPPVVPPVRRGFGTRVIQERLAAVSGVVQLDFHPQGVSCRIGLPYVPSP